jgi:hypothetical protein
MCGILQTAAVIAAVVVFCYGAVIPLAEIGYEMNYAHHTIRNLAP